MNNTLKKIIGKVDWFKFFTSTPMLIIIFALVVWLALTNAGCGSTPETTVSTTMRPATVPEKHDTAKYVGQYTETKKNAEGKYEEKARGWVAKSEGMTARVDTVDKIVYVDQEPRIIQVPFVDSMQVYPTKEIKTPFLTFMGVAFVGGIGMMLLMFGIIMVVKKYLAPVAAVSRAATTLVDATQSLSKASRTNQNEKGVPTGGGGGPTA